MKSSRFDIILFLLSFCAFIFWSIPAQSHLMVKLNFDTGKPINTEQQSTYIAQNTRRKPPLKSEPERLKQRVAKPGPDNDGATASNHIRQPMTELYGYWLAVKFIPELLTDKKILKALEQEVNYAKNYNKYGGDRIPWIPYSEIKNRYTKMVAPRYVDRYKASIRKFTDSLSTQVEGTVELGEPIYNRSKGIMHFRNLRYSTDKLPVRTNLANQLTADYSVFVREYGADYIKKLADPTDGRVLGTVDQDLNTEIRLPGNVSVPTILTQASISNMPNAQKPWNLFFDRNMVFEGLKMSHTEAGRFLKKYGKFYANIKFSITGAVRRSITVSRNNIADVVVFLADVEEVTIYTELVEGTKVGKKVFAVLKARDFSIPTVTLATLQDEHDIEVQEQQETASKAMQKFERKVLKLKQRCLESRDPVCYKELCRGLKMLGYKQQWLSCVDKYKEILNEGRLAP